MRDEVGDVGRCSGKPRLYPQCSGATEGLNQKSDWNWFVLEGSLCPPRGMDCKRAKVEAERLLRRLLDRDQDHFHGKEMQKSKMAVWGGLTNSCEKKRGKKQRRKGKI